MYHHSSSVQSQPIQLCVLIAIFLSLYGCQHSPKPDEVRYPNKALAFDGIDDKVDLYLKPLTKQWTISLWVKGNDTIWNEDEVLVSNGWASIDSWEQTPLKLKNGYPSIGDSITATTKLDNQWHHLAVTNDGNTYKLFVNGELEVSGAAAKGICPSFLGANDNQAYFKGLVDELRIWNTALNPKTIKQWMGKPLNETHQQYSNLVASYNFDDSALDATDLLGHYHGDIKKHYTSTATTDTPKYTDNNNENFKEGYFPSDFKTLNDTRNNYVGLSAHSNPNTLKVLSWNIWHGGVENGVSLGRQRVIEIIKASTADVVLMVETYGAAKQIAEALNFHYYTLGEKDNLAIFSRYPIVDQYPSKFNGFFSLGAKIKMPNTKEVVVWDVWLRYALPDYTMEINNPDYGVQDMIDGDLNYAVKDLGAIFDKDLNSYITTKDIPVILGGDFNSCSHLDWTEDTAKAGLHYGKVVDFPTSKLMMANGFKDSYRDVHPDPVTHIGKTWSPLYNYCDDFRIDFIYFKGPTVKALDSRVIDSHPDPAQMFPSDHAAVLTVFEIK